jgi:hypothetical protein
MRWRRVNDSYAEWRGRLASAINTDFYTIAWLDDQVRSGRAFVLANDHAAIAIEFREFPSGNMAVHGLVAAGDLDQIENELIPMAESWGRSVGCKFGLIESTPAWGRIMKKHGYSPFQLSIVKEL